MRRGGDDELLAISPPPEFQDNPSLPPPVLFRDLSPSVNNNNNNVNNNNNSDSETRKNSIILSQAVQNCIREFADKVSYNILNEAMIIATLIPSAGINDVRSQASNSSFSISSGASYSSDSISTGTSWEYLQNASSFSDISCLSSSFWSVEFSRRKSVNPEKQQRQPERGSRTRLKKSLSDAFMPKSSSTGMSNSGDKRRDLEFPSLKTRNNNLVRKRNLDRVQPVVRGVDDTNHVERNDTREKCGGDSDDAVDVCYNVPFRCDIYSLPVDSVKSSNSSAPARDSSSKTSTSSRRSHARRGKKSNAENRVPGMVLLEEEKNSLRGPTSRKKEQARAGPRQNVEMFEDDDDDENNSNPGARLSEQNNNENSSNVTLGKMRANKKRRSVSVEDGSKSSVVQRKLSQCPESQSSQLVEFGGSKGKRNFGHTLLNLFKRNRPKSKTVQLPNNNDSKNDTDRQVVLVSRALPPPPPTSSFVPVKDEIQSPIEPKDFSASIAKVKDCGWYWGPLASDEAEDLLRGEPDGSFIVRDSSDVHYIFSLTFKLNGLVRHVRIEHDQGNFSFGPLTRFKAATIVEFVEKAVAHSRSGRYLFFLHRRPVLGPMQVQLLHPYSRFRHPRSLQHMCRFVILKYVRRDLLNTLPLPKPLQDYLNTPTNYYFEQQEVSSRSTQQ